MDPRSRSPFGTLLRRHRIAAGWSQERLAETAGLSVRAVSDLERGARRMPRLDTVRMLADALRLSEEERVDLFRAARSVTDGEPSQPPRGVASPPSAPLPVPPTPLVGREPELATLTALLHDPQARLVTLTGPGGVGKTRLALAAAHRLEADFADGVAFISLAPVADPALVVSAVADALGVHEIPGAGLQAALERSLADTQLLLVLDNFEHVLAAAPLVAELLAACPELTVLTTSRTPLHLRGERQVLVPPLGVPDADRLPAVTEAAGTEAVQLFVARAQDLRPDFALDHGNVAAVVEICRRLDGLPLAVELAAARSKVLPPQTLLRRLGRRLPLLTGGARDLPARHQTLQAAIAWSYDLLSREEQSLFRRLAVFAGGCTLEAAEAVVAPDGALDLFEGIAALVEQSLLRQEAGSDGEPRYRMLETVREFARDQLEASGEEADVWTAHAAWYLQLARTAEPALEGAGQLAWLAELGWEQANIRGAVAWLIEHERIEEALDLTGSIWFFYWLRGSYTEGRQLFEELLAHPLGSAGTTARGKALVGLGVIAAHQGDSERALAALGEAVALFRQLGERRYLALALDCEGGARLMVGRIEDGEARITESRAIAEAIGDPLLVQATLCNLGIIAKHRGQTQRAWELLEASLRTARSIGNAWGTALVQLNLGYLELEEGRLAAAERRLHEATQLIEALGDKRDLPGAYILLAEVASQRGDLTEAQAGFARALRAAREIGDALSIAEAQAGIGKLWHRRGEHLEAYDVIRDAIRSFREAGDQLGAVKCLETLAAVAAALGDAAHAAWCLGVVDRLLGQQGRAWREPSSVQRQAWAGTMVETLGAPGYRQVWQAGHAPDATVALDRALTWTPPEPAPAAPSRGPRSAGPTARPAPLARGTPPSAKQPRMPTRPSPTVRRVTPRTGSGAGSPVASTATSSTTRSRASSLRPPHART